MKKSTLYMFASIIALMNGIFSFVNGEFICMTRILGTKMKDPMYSYSLDERPFVLMFMGLVYAFIFYRFFSRYDEMIQTNVGRRNVTVFEFLCLNLFLIFSFFTTELLLAWNAESQPVLPLNSFKPVINMMNIIKSDLSGLVYSVFLHLVDCFNSSAHFLKDHVIQFVDTVIKSLPGGSPSDELPENIIIYWIILTVVMLVLRRFFFE